jgi:hypothetical protein
VNLLLKHPIPDARSPFACWRSRGRAAGAEATQQAVASTGKPRHEQEASESGFLREQSAGKQAERRSSKLFQAAPRQRSRRAGKLRHEQEASESGLLRRAERRQVGEQAS